MKDDLSGFNAFVTVADKRSFIAAGRELGVTGSAISQAVSLLEERLGVRLLQRTTRSVGLTEAGEQLHASVKPALSQMRLAVESLNELREKPVGTLRLNVASSATSVLYEPLFIGFLREHPALKIELVLEDRLADIVASGFDAGVRLGEVLERDMIAVPISGPVRMIVVGSPSYFAKHPKPKHPRDLHAHDCIAYRKATGEIYRWEFMEKGKGFEIAVDPKILVNDLSLAVKLATDGVGLTFCFEENVQAQLASKKLVRVLDAFSPPFPGWYLYYSGRAHMPLKLRALVDYLKKRRRLPKK
jgi:DNA-binding transcriptional LysR family regulator